MEVPARVLPVLAAGLTLSVLLAGCAAPEGLERPAGLTSRDPAAGVVQVAMADFTFSPHEMWLRAGSKVDWRNEGNLFHTATARVGDATTGDVAPGGRVEQVFPDPGTYAYKCDYHEARGMYGVIHVVA